MGKHQNRHVSCVRRPIRQGKPAYYFPLMTRQLILGLALALQICSLSAEAQQQCASLKNLISVKKAAPDSSTEGARVIPIANAAQDKVRPSIVNDDIDLASMSLARLETVGNVVKKLSAVARLSPAIVICADDQLNAFAARDADAAIVGIDLALLNLLKHDANAMAFVLSHEMAHLILGHTTRQLNRQREAVEAVATGAEYEKQSGRRGAGIIVARMASAGKLAAFSRAQEQDADDTGYQLLVMAGFEPAGALNAAKLMEITAGNEPTGFFSTHPGWAARYTRLEQVAKVDIQKREQAQKIDAQRASDVQNIEFAERLLSTRSWKDLAPFVRTWLDRSPESSPAWYYHGLLLKQSRGNGSRAISAFESAVKFDPRNANAWFELCELLIKLGFRRESAHCGSDMQGTGLYGEFREHVYQDTLFSHGREIIPPRPMYMGKDERGATRITNDEATRQGWNVSAEPVPPGRTILKSQ